MRHWICLVLLIVTDPAWAEEAPSDWPMLAHDAGRSGATSLELRAPFERKWYRLFTDEGLMSGVQPIIADGRVYIGTLHGTFYALDSTTGRDLWKFQAGGAILHTAAYADGRVLFGSGDGTVQAVSSKDGKLLWEVQTGSAVWNAPAIVQGIAYIGSRDQNLYAIDASTGMVKWRGAVGGPLLGSPAVDSKNNCVYAAAEDMRVYAWESKTGKELWQSEKLPGVSFRGYHPVIAPDGSVMVTSAPGISVDTFQALLLQMVKEVFGDFASWRHSKEANSILREENFALLAKPETYGVEMNFLRRRLAEEPTLQTFFVLDAKSGQSKFVVPIVYSESMNGPGAPPLVAPDGRVIVKFQALLRSRYEHYSPFLNVGTLDTATGEITPLMDQTRTYGWFDSLLLVHDEQAQLSLAGTTLINTHQDNVNGLDLGTLEGFIEPFCRNIHEPKPREAMAIWARLLHNETLPPGKEWLARGTAVYGGGSVLDTAVSIAGDSFYYLPTHELNSGAALIAYRMNPAGTASKETELRPASLTEQDWHTVQKLPWDWDTLETRRLSPILESLPGKIPGTRQLPLTNQAAQAVTLISDDVLDQTIWLARSKDGLPSGAIYTSGLKEDLQKAIRELISKEWRPLVFPSGKFPEESYPFFAEPAETLYTLALAYPHLDADLQKEVKAHIERLEQPGGPLADIGGKSSYELGKGENRSGYTPLPEKLLKVQTDIVRQGVAKLYPFWLWASTTSDWSKLEADWPNLREMIDRRPNPFEEDCRNGYLAGVLAYCRIAQHMKDSKAVDEGLVIARQALRDRLLFEFAHPRGGLIWQVPKMRSIFSRWRYLTPEIGHFLGQHVKPVHSQLMELYVDYHRPTWWLAWNVETMMRNESPFEFPTMSTEIFAARSLILGETPQKLALFIDRPWCRADEYYIQKLALTLDSTQKQTWMDTRSAQ